MQERQESGSSYGEHSIRQQLKAVNYDTSKFLESMVQNMEDLTPEQLLVILEDSCEKLMEVSDQIEDEVEESQESARVAEIALYQELDMQTQHLVTIQTDVEVVLKRFDEASSGAVRLGERLSAAESERTKISFAEQLLGYIEFFEGTEPKGYVMQLQGSWGLELKSRLPSDLRKKDWGEVSRILFNLRRILYDVSCVEAKRAEENVRNLSEAVEKELLSQFEAEVSHMLEDPGSSLHIKKAQALAQWLHLFNNGSTLQKRFIFSVVEKRIPQAVGSFLARLPSGDSDYDMLMQLGKGGADELKMGHEKGSTGSPPPLPSPMDNPSALIDHLSELFVSISDLCQEQFSIIRQVFPAQSTAKVTKMLISRIFNDPAFGIQARVDGVLHPKPPIPPLSPSDYLDALVTVREKLSALHLMLLEYCSEDMSSFEHDDDHSRSDGEAAHSYSRGPVHPHALDRVRVDSHTRSASGYLSSVHRLKEERQERQDLEKRLKVEELQAFIEDQVAQVFQSYLRDYFVKETHFFKTRLQMTILGAVGEDSSSLLTKTVDSTLARLKPDKVRSIEQLLRSVASPQFTSLLLTAATDAVSRMTHIGRDDSKKLPVCVKDVFLMLTTFLTDSIFLPVTRAAKLQADKLASSRRQQMSPLPPTDDFLQLFASLNFAVKRYRTHFQDTFAKPLSVQPNALTVCQESRRVSLKAMENAITEAIQAYSGCLVRYYEKVLNSVQSRYDFSPKFDSGNVGIEPTNACRRICAHVKTVVTRGMELLGADMPLQEILWNPFGRQFAAVLITHIKRQKVSEEGAFALVRDMDEYNQCFASMDCSQARDLILCLREIVYVYMTPADNVVKMVSEDLRHLNTHVVLSMLRSRADFNPKAPWMIRLGEVFAMSWESPLPWEISGNTSKGRDVNKFIKAAADVSGSVDSGGPSSLRKVSSLRDPTATVASAGGGGSDKGPRTTGAAGKTSAMRRALAPSAEEMASDAVLGSTASRYAAVKNKRSGYFIDSSLGAVRQPSVSAASSKETGPHSHGNHGTTRATLTQMHHATNHSEDISLQVPSSQGGGGAGSPLREKTHSRRNSPMTASNKVPKSSPSTASARSTMFGKVSSAMGKLKGIGGSNSKNG